MLKQSLSYGNANRLYQEAALDAEGRLTEERKEQMYLARQSETEAWRAIGDGIPHFDKRRGYARRRRVTGTRHARRADAGEREHTCPGGAGRRPATDPGAPFVLRRNPRCRCRG